MISYPSWKQDKIHVCLFVCDALGRSIVFEKLYNTCINTEWVRIADVLSLKIPNMIQIENLDKLPSTSSNTHSVVMVASN
jgi:hypothetical protein